MAALGPTFQLFIDQVVHLAEHPLGDLRRVEVRPAANLPIEDRYQVRRSALLVLANDSCQIGEVPLLCRPTGSDEGLVAQRLAHHVLSRMGIACNVHRSTKPCCVLIMASFGKYAQTVPAVLDRNSLTSSTLHWPYARPQGRIAQVPRCNLQETAFLQRFCIANQQINCDESSTPTQLL